MGAVCIEWFPGDDRGDVCAFLGFRDFSFVECVYSSGLIEKQGSLFLTGVFCCLL